MDICELKPGDIIVLSDTIAQFVLPRGEGNVVVITSVIEHYPAGHANARTLVTNQVINVWDVGGMLAWRDEWLQK